MNKCIESINDITSDDILEGFLGFGLFADKIPDFLSSKSFFDWYKMNSMPQFENKGKDYIRYENMRNINIPRVLSIPNPFAYANLCKIMSDNWDNIKNKIESNLKGQTLKISRIHIRKMKGKKHLFEMNYKNINKDGEPEQDIMIGKQYCVEADISNCFPSIYSHSIPWALVGKEIAKERRDIKTEWYNKLDRALRNIKNEETNGLLIGPHISNLISEIILTDIDKTLYDRGYRYIRNIDDYKCYVSSYEDSEKFLLDLSTELKKYELYLNNKKTRVTQLPLTSVNNWVNRLNNFYIGDKITEKGEVILEFKQLRSIIDLAIELMKEESNSAILNYTFKIISTKYLGARARQYYFNYVHHLLLLYPYLTSVVDNYVFAPFDIDVPKLKEISIDLYHVGIEKRFYEACSYSIFWALKYDFKLEKNIYDDSINSNDCIFLMLGYVYSKKYNKIKILRKYKDKAKELSTNDFDRYWIFIYEVVSQTELSGDYKRIKKEKISFIKSDFIS